MCSHNYWHALVSVGPVLLKYAGANISFDSNKKSTFVEVIEHIEECTIMCSYNRYVFSITSSHAQNQVCCKVEDTIVPCSS